MYALPLFFVCVKTNVDYQVVAEFIVESETGHSISEALEIIHSWNKDFWAPRFFMTDFSEAEINAIEHVFDNCTVYICDFHREQAWLRWVKKKDHNLNSDEQTQLLDMLRAIANTPPEQTRRDDNFETSVKKLKESVLWSNQQVKRWLETTWFPVSHRWARAFRSEDFDVNVHTNNGIEAQNKTVKYTYLSRQPDKTLASIVETIIEDFLEIKKENYDNANIRSLASNRGYHSSIPVFLHNRPRKVVKHCLGRINEAADMFAQDITALTNGEENPRQIYLVKSASDDSLSYSVDIQTPSCQCKDWLRSRLPCKHMFAIIKYTNETWHSIQSKYREGAYMTLDVKESTESKETEGDTSILAEENPIIEEQNEQVPTTITQPVAPLDVKLLRKGVLLKLEELKTITYLCDNVTTLKFALEAIETINFGMKAAIPRSSEGLLLETGQDQQKGQARKRKRKAKDQQGKGNSKRSSLTKRKKRKKNL